MPTRCRVRIDVGGTVFSTSEETLRVHPYFSRLLDEEVPDPETDILFVDRDPTHFRTVLNYLRGSAVLPVSPHSLRELRQEADFYSLSALVERVDELLVAVEEESAASDEAHRSVSDRLSMVATQLGRIHDRLGEVRRSVTELCR
jgi:hypothetical protein